MTIDSASECEVSPTIFTLIKHESFQFLPSAPPLHLHTDAYTAHFGVSVSDRQQSRSRQVHSNARVAAVGGWAGPVLYALVTCKISLCDKHS
jgi:hypothetical protein